MNYQRHYDLLVEKARSRVKPKIFEKHHVIPKCLGGSDEKENLICLTPSEHFVAHLLLAKIFNKRELWYAVRLMCVSNPHQARPTNKLYGWVRRKCIEAQVGSKRSAETRKKQSLARIGKKHSAETIEKLKKPKSDEFKLKMSTIRSGKSPGKSKVLTCPHCGKQGQARGLTKWHFDNCRILKEN